MTESEPSGLVGITGMSSTQFAEQTAAMMGYEAPEEDGVPGTIVMRADYDNVLNAIRAESPRLADLVDQSTGNKTIADSLQAIVGGARLFSRQRSLEPSEIVMVQKLTTATTIIFKCERA
jgi:hypothetical protein